MNDFLMKTAAMVLARSSHRANRAMTAFGFFRRPGMSDVGTSGSGCATRWMARRIGQRELAAGVAVLSMAAVLLWAGNLQAALRGAPPVVFSVEPEEDGRLVYLPIGAPTASESASQLFGLRVRMVNNGADEVRLNNIRITFTNPDQSVFAFQFPRDLAVPGGETITEYLEKDESIELSANPPSSARIQLFFEGYGTPVSLQRQLAPYIAPTAQGKYLFPGNAADLGTDEYFSHIVRHTGGSQYFGYDFHVQGWNGSKFSGIKAGGDSSKNEDRVGWNVPIYAMAEGTVLRAVTGIEDNPVPGMRVIQRMGEETTTGITDVNVTRFSAERAASVVRSASGRLGITVWDTEDIGRQLHARGSVTAEPVKRIDADALTGTRLVTAVRTADDNLRVIVWDVSGDGQTITRKGARDAAEVEEVSLIKMSSSRFATATRQADGNLRIIVWEVSDDGLNISLIAHDFAGEATSISAVALSGTRLAISLRTAGGALKVIIWDVVGGNSLVRRGDVNLELITRAASAKRSGNQLVTAMRTAAGNLKVVQWLVSEDGDSVTLERAANAGQIQDVAPPAVDGGNVFVSVVTQGGLYKNIIWRQPDEDDGEDLGLLYRFAEREAGPTDRMSADILDGSLYFTGVRTVSGDLKVITWKMGSGGGNSLVILHGNCRVLYAHFREGTVNPALTSPGAKVAPGQYLGRMGNSGSSSGPHTHIHASRVSSLLSVEDVIELEAQDKLTLYGYRPIPFHCARAMRLSDIQPGGTGNPANDFASLNGQGVYFEQFGIRPNWLKELYVDWSSNCLAPTGLLNCTPFRGLSIGGPYRTVNSALDHACWGHRLFIRAGSYVETVTFDRAMTVESYEGPVVIGQ